jgi:hypothetical protein
MKNLKLMGVILTRDQMKTVFGGGNQCLCKNKNTGGAWFDDVSSCDNCGSRCDEMVPREQGYTSWICSGPVEQNGPVETIQP